MSLISFIISVIIALIIGVVADKVSPFDMPGGWIGAIVAGFVGAWVGPMLFGTWGPEIEGFLLVPSLIGAFVVIIVVGIIASIFN
ncbi:MAG TPA: GlsB/YeaQ/YmgE family stress response membrane protein [Chondromyces sp.]|nr:GlsB/YeaQ/YmgE family stress response membrane protein [Chondromyces sp.]